jgi:uncharacterized protein YegL
MFSWISKTLYGENPAINEQTVTEESKDTLSNNIKENDNLQTSVLFVNTELTSHIRQQATFDEDEIKSTPKNSPASLNDNTISLTLEKSVIETNIENIFNELTLSPKQEELEKDMHIVMLLDESSSMQPNRHEVIKAVNEFIKSQSIENLNNNINNSIDNIINNSKYKTIDSKFTLITFDDNFYVSIDNIPISQVKFLTRKDYRPDGCTALYDTIGFAIDKFKYKKNLILVIVTDGSDNCSKNYTGKNISNLINNYKNNKNYNWNFIYLVNDPLLLNDAENINIINNPSQYERNNCYSCNLDFSTLTNYMTTSLNATISSIKKRTC